MSFQNPTVIPATSSAEDPYFFCQGVCTTGKPCRNEISRKRWVRQKVRYCFYHEEQAAEGNNDNDDDSSSSSAAVVPCTHCRPSFEALSADLADANAANQSLANETDAVSAQRHELEQELAATNEQCDQLVKELGQAREDGQGLRTLVLEVCRANGDMAALNQRQKKRHGLDERRHRAQHAAAEERLKEEHAEAEKKLRDQHAGELSALRAENAMRCDACEQLAQTNARLVLDLTTAASTATQLREDAVASKLEVEASSGRADRLADEVGRVRAEKERLAFRLALANCRMLTVTTATSDLLHDNPLGSGDANDVLAATTSLVDAAIPQAEAQDDDDANHRAAGAAELTLTADQPEASRDAAADLHQAESMTSKLPSVASAADDDSNDDDGGDHDDGDAGTADFAADDAGVAAKMVLHSSISGAALVFAGVLGLSWALGGW
ncbi:uncharacterized protein LTHEOB_11357 [Lasiodiplodia theobromae]|uniref:uncharacterized protein n=1 Tax=Lasiodiplodia theobromae TaxID=45133 RepID=UPI0015C2C843|nr:uncharacterized protein LTHEOB_11357 [Lasiodiplodia theobromae]KAF4537873.1 hypothetical protein LTHEOB_11357 [Lasiodiplodia theobromae]